MILAALPAVGSGGTDTTAWDTASPGFPAAAAADSAHPAHPCPPPVLTRAWDDYGDGNGHRRP